MRIIRYILLILVVIVLVVGGVLAYVYNQWTMGPLPQHEGTLQVAGLGDKVEIIRDTWGVPHIYASNSYDLFFVQGFTHAQDRWWQMEFFRHIGSGRIQELTGENSSILGQDIFIRTAGWRQAAERDLTMLSEETKAYLQAFADGVNAYIHSRSAGQLAFEYNILGLVGVKIAIEDWTPVDTLVWTKVMSENLGSNRDEEIFASDLINKYGEEMAAAYAPDYPFGEKPTIIQPEDLPPAGEPFAAAYQDTAGIPVRDTRLAGNFRGRIDYAFGSGESLGSNNWVVSGGKTESGHPLLANDPHLGIQMPSIWYEIGLHCQPVSEECPFEVRGLTFSLSPGVIIGHKAKIAWGVTNVGPDTQDLYLIKVNPENPLQYEWNGEWREMTEREEVIRAGDTDTTVTIKVRETHLGPIINDNQRDEDGKILGYNNENPMAFHWTAYEPGTILDAVLLLNRAQNWNEFRNALRFWDTPSQNFVYADTEGNIGYQTPGNIPIRAAGHTGLLPVDGTTDKYEWKGYVPFENLPSVFNPARGYIATANQALLPPEYYSQLAETLGDEFGADSHYAFGYQWAYGYRGQRIVELLQASDKHTFATFGQIHGDNKMIVAEELAPYLKGVDFGDAGLNELRDWMLDWDYQMNMVSSKAALFGMFWAKLMHHLYDDQLAAIDETASGGGQHMWATKLLVEQPDNPWWDDINTTDVIESRDEIVIRAFREAHDALVEAQGNDREKWAWGALHTATFVSNPLGASGIDLIENIVNRGPVQTGGGSEIINATGWNIETLTVRALPSMRMVIDAGDFANSQIVHTTGQSGHPFSPQYGDMIEDWRNIRYHPMLWTREQVEANRAKTLILQPTG